MSQIWHSAKIFFLENTLPSASDTALGKEFFFPKGLCRGALGKEEFFLKKFKTLFVECLILGTRQRPPLPSAMLRHSVKFFFVFGLQIFCTALLKYQELLVRIWGFFVAF